MKSVRKRLTYANVMSTIAVFLVLGGATAFAATKIGTSEIKAGAITSGKIAKEAVGTAKIKNNAVNGGKLADGAVTGSKLGGGAVGASNLAANSVGGSALADNSVNGSKIVNGAVTEGKIAGGAVTEGKIAGGAVTEGKIANDAVVGSKVKDGSLTGSDIQQSTLTQVKAGNVYGVTYAETGTGSPKIISATDPGIKAASCFLACPVEFPVNVSECSATVSSTAIGASPGVAGTGETVPSSNPNTILVAMYDKESNLTSHNFTMTVVCPSTS
jgi:hypothetical protein